MQIYEIVAVTSDAHKEISVVFGFSLSVTERFLIDDVELDVMPTKPEECSDEVHNLLQIFLSWQELVLLLELFDFFLRGSHMLNQDIHLVTLDNIICMINTSAGLPLSYLPSSPRQVLSQHTSSCQER